MNLKTPVLLLCVAATLAGCTKRESAVDRGNREQILHLGIGGEPKDLDPQTTSGMPEFSIQSALFEGLTDERPGEFVRGGAR